MAHGKIPNEGFIILNPDFKSWHEFVNSTVKKKIEMKAQLFNTETEKVVISLEIEGILPPKKLQRRNIIAILTNAPMDKDVIRANSSAEEFMINNALMNDCWILLGKIVSKEKADNIIILYFVKIYKASYCIFKKSPKWVNPAMN